MPGISFPPGRCVIDSLPCTREYRRAVKAQASSVACLFGLHFKYLPPHGMAIICRPDHFTVISTGPKTLRSSARNLQTSRSIVGREPHPLPALELRRYRGNWAGTGRLAFPAAFPSLPSSYAAAYANPTGSWQPSESRLLTARLPFSRFAQKDLAPVTTPHDALAVEITSHRGEGTKAVHNGAAEVVVTALGNADLLCGRPFSPVRLSADDPSATDAVLMALSPRTSLPARTRPYSRHG